MSKEIYISICHCRRGDRRSRGLSFAVARRLGGVKNIAIVASCLLSFFAFLTINPMPFYNGQVFAGPGTATLSDSTITLASASNITSVNLIPDSGFKLSESNDTASYDVITNNFSGYTITLLAADDNRTLVNTVNDDMVINSITSPILQTDFVMSNAALRNRWGIKPNKYYSAGSTITNTTTILPGPTSSGIVLDVTNAANSSAARYDVALGAMVDGTLPAGTYTRVATLAVVPNPIHYAITYDKNTDDAVTNIPAVQSASTTETSIVISSDIPLRNQYTFSGWCLGTITTTDNIDSCSGTVFQPGDDFGIDQTTANISTLYAMWRIESVTVELTAGAGIDSVAITGTGVKSGGESGSTTSAEVYYNGEITITATPAATYEFENWTGDATYTDNPQTITNITNDLSLTANASRLDSIQNLSASSCIADGPTKVYDTRDNQVYTVQRLADGNCWMTQNLKLGKATTSLTLTSEDSDTSASGFTLNGKLTNGVFTNKTIGGVANVNNSSEYYCSDDYGCLYNWYTSTAGSGSSVTTSGSVEYSICPAGWALPTGGDAGQYQALSAYYTPIDMLVSPSSATENINGEFAPGFLLGGYGYYGGHDAKGVSGFYWTATTQSAMYGYNQLVGASSYTVNTFGKYNGAAVRCVMDESKTMQEFSNDDAEAMATNETQTLKDSRDGQKYTVTKLGDGNVWMTRNLAIGCNGSGTTYGGTAVSRTLTSADSNVATDFSTSTTPLSTGNSNANAYQTCDSTYGAWYNYVSASAGTVTGSSNLQDATYSVCPKGWRLPTQTDFESINTNGYMSNFSPVLGRYWYGGTYANNNYGIWWGSTAAGANYRVAALYGSIANQFQIGIGSGISERERGYYVRCVFDQTPAMQNIESSTLNSLVPSAGSSVVLKDVRDGKKYTVTKLADGNVWMTQNLAFTGTELTPADTNVASSITMSYGDLTFGNSYTEARIHDSGNGVNGVWYNYAAASAGTITGNSDINKAQYDVCPAGWRLPSSTEIDGVTSYSSHYSPVIGGGYYDGTIRYASNYGFWWSSTPVNSNLQSRYNLRWDGTNLIIEQNSMTRQAGFYVRCIYNGPEKTMQSFTSADSYAMATNTTKVLTDSRDGNKYTVTKLADGRVWMTQNLAFKGTELTPADSNVTSNVTMSYGDLTSGNSYTEARIHDSSDNINGIFYNYAAASALNITGENNSANATQDICPAGWRLPAQSEMDTLATKVSVASFNVPTSMIYYLDGGVRTSVSVWWSSTRSSEQNMYQMQANNSTFTISPSGYRGRNGFNVRCILNETNNISQISTMQQFNDLSAIEKSMVASSMTVDTVYSLKDNRDNQSYNVAKLQDGKIWMANDLKLGATSLTQDLTSENTNIINPITASTYNSWKHSGTSTNTSGKYVNSGSIMLYNYYAISAGTIAGDSNTDNAVYDICPAGWKLISLDDIQTIYGLSSYNTYAKLRAAPTSFNMIGYFINGGITNTGNEGDYWLSTAASDATKMSQFYLRLREYAVIFLEQDRTHGAGARCIVK